MLIFQKIFELFQLRSCFWGEKKKAFKKQAFSVTE